MTQSPRNASSARTLHVDVAILGAGTAGAACAFHCASRGLKVVLVEKKSREKAGARWVNGVTARQFVDAGIPLPTGDELVCDAGPFHMIANEGPTRVRIEGQGDLGHGILDVDMRKLVSRLQTMAEEAGAIFEDDAELQSDNEELCGGNVVTKKSRYKAKVVVDATGLHGRHLLNGPKVPPQHLCVAAQDVFDVKDPAAADAFFVENRVPPGEVCCFTGVEGGYSIINVRKDHDHIAVLTGSIPGLGFASGKIMLDRFVDDLAFIGKKRFGGARAIPLRRPRDVLGEARVAAIGDAGCQVFSAHGSGIGLGMVAARLLAETLSAGGSPADYSRAFLRRHGGLLAAYDLFRRFSATFSSQDLETLIQSGLFDDVTAASGMAQVWPRMSLQNPAEALQMASKKLLGLPKARRLLPRLLPVAMKMPLLAALYADIPEDDSAWDHAGLFDFSRRVARIFNEEPDVRASR